MSHCTCRSKPDAAPVSVAPLPVTADAPVEEIARRPGARAVLHALGIDTCCGAGLPLREAAAAAGVPLEAALAALAVDGTLDVRGLPPPQPMVLVLDRLETLGPGQALTVVHDRRPTLLYPQLEDRGFAHRTDEPAAGVVRIVIERAAA